MSSGLAPPPPSSRGSPSVRQPRCDASSTSSQSTRRRMSGSHSSERARGATSATANRRTSSRRRSCSAVSPKNGVASSDWSSRAGKGLPLVLRQLGCRQVSDRGVAAVDHQLLAEDVVRLAAREEDDGGGDLLRLAEPAGRELVHVV